VNQVRDKEVEGPAPWAKGRGGASRPPRGRKVSGRAPAAKVVAAACAAADRSGRALLSTSKVSPSKSAAIGTTIRNRRKSSRRRR
jgi:hypothetical protein